MSEIDQKIHQAIMTVENPKFDLEGQVQSRRYPYASLKACMEVVHTACEPLGLSVSFDMERIAEDTYHVSTVISDGKEQRKKFPVPCDMNSSMQNRGSAITYAKRYSVSGTFALISEHDDDGAAVSQQNVRRVKNTPKTQRAGTPKVSPLKAAVDRLNAAMAVYATNHGADFNKIKEGVKKRPDYVKEADWFNDVAAEFESDNESWTAS